MTGSSVLGLFSLAGRTALVTGGSSGMGRSIALGLAEAGADVAIQFSSLADERAGVATGSAETLDGIRAFGRRGAALDFDLSAPGGGRDVFARASQSVGQIDIVVLSAAIHSRMPWTDVTEEVSRREFAVNFESSVFLLQRAVPPMVNRGWGRVLFIGTVNQICPRQDLAVYSALKCAQTNFAVNLAKEYAATGVTFNVLSPGLVETPRNSPRRQDPGAWRAITAAENPMRRAGQPHEVTGAALLLCSPASSFITGVDLMVDGGGHIPNRD
jgi:NAD(P)-dependent dehydrogenase (short-subunit alcohol dehydrogenase family)